MTAAQNIELKARINDLQRARSAAEQLATEPLGQLSQCDTYFRCVSGRLKLRECPQLEDELIWYQRPDTPESSLSCYTRVPVSDSKRLKRALGNVLGIEVVVEKSRDVFLWDNVRIHLDQVHPLGTFVEFEAVLSQQATQQQGHEQLAELQRVFGIPPEDRISHSYRELMLAPVDRE